ncbi:rod-determining factor RdfA [Natrialbaceae archaeon GCM10025810]|uniref:rod-determining factor RdfA n=1 Tax=Halovalidus salilacus TaxID=3075124 RepID=UPI0036210452
MSGSEEANANKRRTKIARLIDEYGLNGFGEELEQMWTAEKPDRKSLRELAEMVNKRILRSALDDSGIALVSADVDSIYTRLADKEGSSADKTRVRRQLEREGVDVDTLESDFVTYQAVRSFLQKERNAEYMPSENPIERDKTSIQQLRSRTAAVTKTKLEGLDKAEEIDIGSHQVTVNINVYCEECGRLFDVTEILDQRGCDCTESES